MHISRLFRAILAVMLAVAFSSPASAQPSSDRVGGGETDLTILSTAFGAGLGIAVPLAMGADASRKLYGAAIVVGAPIGFFGAKAITRSRPVSRGQAVAISWGGYWGGLQGYLLATAMDPAEGGALKSASTEDAAASVIAGSALGLAGGLLAARQGISYRTANSAMMGSVWGNWFGVASWKLMGEDRSWSGSALLALAGNAGLVGGAIVGSRLKLTESQSRWINMSGSVGAVAAGGLERATRGDGEPATFAYALPGSILGLAVGAVLARTRGGKDDTSANPQAGGTVDAPGALLSRSGGAWSLSAPLPSLAREPTLRPDGRDALLWKVPLLKVRF